MRTGRTLMDMTLHVHRYIELAAPPAVAAAMLRDHPPLNAERLGELWRWQNELWSFELQSRDPLRLYWQGRLPTDRSAGIFVSVTLDDATLSSHATIHAAYDPPGGAVPFLAGRARTRRELERQIDEWIRRLQTRLAATAPTPSVDPNRLSETLRQSHPHTVAAFEAMQALPALEEVAALDVRWQATEAGAVPEGVYCSADELPPTRADFDLVYAGGGLSVLHAAVMARCYGYRVLLFDRGEVGCAHREWNISDHELAAMVRLGLFTADELERVVMRRYRDGVVRFWPEHTGVRAAELRMPKVLNVAIDAAGLLQLSRRKLEAAGGTVLDHRSFTAVHVREPGAVGVEVRGPDGAAECYGGRVLVDGMGATSPLALRRFAGRPFAGVCPTVGTVVTGLERGTAPDQHNPEVGDILVSNANAQGGRQLIWEGFAGRDDELTVYLFYYDVTGHNPRLHRQSSSRRHSLLDLFEAYFQLLPSYKRPGPAFRHLKPVYGFIPARHTQRRLSVSLLPGVLPIGDSSAQQSPLTFCGFGSHVRNLDRTTRLLHIALQHGLLRPQDLGLISAYQANVALNWVFSRFMQPWDSPADVNRLQNVFARVLNEIGVDVAVRFFQDQMTWRDYGRIVNHTLAVYKPIIPTALRVLGPRDTARWVLDWLRFSAAAAGAALGRAVGSQRLDALEALARRVRPRWAFRLMSLRAEWRAMGWA